MSRSLISRLVRPAILLVAGMLLGQGALAIAAPSRPQATQTRIASCAGFDFHPINSRTVADWEGRIKYRRTEDGDGWFMCNAHLPHRAVVTKVRFTVHDGDEDIELQDCGLGRIPLTVSGGWQGLALPVSGTGMGSTPGTQRYSSTNISFATVDNGKFGYSFQCRIVFADDLAAIFGPYAGIIGADVTYSISSANG